MEKLHEIQWNSMKKNLHGIPWNSMEKRTFMEFQNPPWNSMEFHVPNPDRMEFHGKRTFMEFHGIPKPSMEFHGIPCPKPRQNSMEFHGKFSMELHGIPWNSMEFHGVILHGLHRYHRGHEFESRSSLSFFQAFLCKQLKLSSS